MLVGDDGGDDGAGGASATNWYIYQKSAERILWVSFVFGSGLVCCMHLWGRGGGCFSRCAERAFTLASKVTKRLGRTIFGHWISDSEMKTVLGQVCKRFTVSACGVL